MASGTTTSKGQRWVRPAPPDCGVRGEVSRSAGFSCDAHRLLLEDMPTFAMPVRDATNQSERILSLWQGSWIAALAVGALTWGLILWAVIALPPQARRDRAAAADALQPADRGPLHRRRRHHDRGVLLLHRPRRRTRSCAVVGNPDHTDHGRRHAVVVEFNYVSDGDADATTSPARRGKPPTLYLPVRARRAVHAALAATSSTRSGCRRSCSRWTSSPAGRTSFELTPDQDRAPSTGRCAELCGVDHSRMLFNVKVVTPGRVRPAYLKRTLRTADVGAERAVPSDQAPLTATGAGATGGAVARPAAKGSIVVRWITTTDHKVIGNLYLITSFAFFLVGGVMAHADARRAGPARACRSSTTSSTTSCSRCTARSCCCCSRRRCSSASPT